jgi:hypothetical protein
MDLYTFFQDIQNSAPAQFVNTFGATYPVVESIHVLAVALVFGSIFVVDLRLLGLASTNRPFTRVGVDLLRLTWLGFALAVITGVMLFAPNAASIYQNSNFWIKMGLILLAGVNMAILELVTARNVSAWDHEAKPPTAARVAGLLSILFWAAVVVFGRLIGFTTVTDDPFSGLI